MAIVVQVVSLLSVNYALGHLPASLVSPTLLGQPVITAIAAVPLLGQALSAAQVIGGAVVLADSVEVAPSIVEAGSVVVTSNVVVAPTVVLTQTASQFICELYGPKRIVHFSEPGRAATHSPSIHVPSHNLQT